MRVRWTFTKARHAAISFEVVEWSEQLRSVTSAWLGAVRRSVRIRLCTSGCKSEKMFGNMSPPRDLLLLLNNYSAVHQATKYSELVISGQLTTTSGSTAINT